MLFGYVIEKTDATLNYIKGHTKRFKNSPLMVNFKQSTHTFDDRLVYECEGKVKFTHAPSYLGFILICISIVSYYIVNYYLGGDRILNASNYFLIGLGLIFIIIDLGLRTRLFFWIATKANLKDIINYKGKKRLLSKEEILNTRLNIKPKFKQER